MSANYAKALLQGKCPRCHSGKMFVYPARNIFKFAVMHRQCPHCGVRLEPEPGFYQGAMYVGYGITVALIVAIGSVLYVAGNPSEWVYIGVVMMFMLLVAPLNFRYSRIIYLYLFGGIKFDPRYAQ